LRETFLIIQSIICSALQPRGKVFLEIDSPFTTRFIIHSNVLAHFPEGIRSTHFPRIAKTNLSFRRDQMKTARSCTSYVAFYGPLSRTGHFHSRLVNREFACARAHVRVCMWK